MKNSLALLLIVVFGISACKNDNEDLQVSDDIEITSGFVCGWCSVADSMVINSTSFNYESFNPCTFETKEKISNGTLSALEWNELVQKLDFDTFKNIDLNSCNVCVDGCDNWIKVRQGNEIHKITYGYHKSDSLAFEAVLPFIEELEVLKLSLITP